MLVDVDPDFLEDEQELRVGEAEHAQRSLITDALGDGSAVRRFEVGDAKGNFFVEGHDLDTPRRGNSEAGVEKVDGVAFAGDVEIVKVPEKLRRALAEAEAAARRACGFLIHRFENLESRREAFALLVEDEGAVFHAASGEEADVARAGELLRGTAGGGFGVWGRARCGT